MSKTVPVSFEGRWFWAYDVSLGILLLEAIDVATEPPTDPLLAPLWAQIEVGAAYEFALDDPAWTITQRSRIIELLTEAASRLRARGTITAEAANQRYRLNGKPFHLRMARVVDGTVIAALADNIILLLRDDLPPSPDPSRHWFFGAGPEPTLL